MEKLSLSNFSKLDDPILISGTKFLVRSGWVSWPGVEGTLAASEERKVSAASEEDGGASSSAASALPQPPPPKKKKLSLADMLGKRQEKTFPLVTNGFRCCEENRAATSDDCPEKCFYFANASILELNLQEMYIRHKFEPVI